jgi:hypothetical protein
MISETTSPRKFTPHIKMYPTTRAGCLNVLETQFTDEFEGFRAEPERDWSTVFIGFLAKW